MIEYDFELSYINIVESLKRNEEIYICHNHFCDVLNGGI